MVAFDECGRNILVNAGEVEVIGANDFDEPQECEHDTQDGQTQGCDHVLPTLEALRMGVVPPQGCELYTVGRDKEIELIRADLRQASQQGAIRVFLGDYGTGKTHLLDYIEAVALQMGYVVGRVVLDGHEVAPSHPKRVYRALIRSLRYPTDSRRGLLPLLEAFVKSERQSFFEPPSHGDYKGDYHYYLSPVAAYFRELNNYKDDNLRQLLLDWIEGYPTESNRELEVELRNATGLREYRLYALTEYRTWAHIYAYIVGGISFWAKWCGFKGLVVLFDEAEFYAVLSSEGQEFAERLFGYYAAAAIGGDSVCFDLERAPRGGHAIHRSFPPIYKARQPLYCVFAMTNDPYGIKVLRSILPENYFTVLSALELADYQLLCRKVVDLYQQGYPELEVGEQVQNPLGKVVFNGVESGVFSNPRQVLKFVIEVLDFTRLCKDKLSSFINEVTECLRRR